MATASVAVMPALAAIRLQQPLTISLRRRRPPTLTATVPPAPAVPTIGSVLAAMLEGALVLDAEMRVVAWNDRYPALTGLPAERFRVGVAWREVLLGPDAVAETEAGGPPWRVRSACLRALGPERASTGAEPQTWTRADGTTVERWRHMLPDGGIVSVCADATALRRATQAQAEALRSAEEAAARSADYTAVVSHEIRTPLHALLGSLALLDESGLTAPQRRFAAIAREGGDALLDLVDDVLAMSRLDAVPLELREAPLDLAAFLHGVASLFESPAAAVGIALAVRVDPGLPSHVVVDPGRLRQILMNYIGNATKFSPPGPVVIEARRHPAPSRGDWLRVSVRDHGLTIPAAQVERLFRPFSRLVPDDEDAIPGTGLGLAICQRLARLMGGAVGVDRIMEAEGAAFAGPGRGNEFWVGIPLRAAPVALVASPAIPPRTRRASVLLVEDVRASHVVTATMLRRAGHRVDVAESGPEALRLAAGRPFDVVLLDLSLPGMDGLETAARLRRLPGPTSAAAIVAMTADVTVDVAAYASAGVDARLDKPPRPAALLDLIQQRAGCRRPADSPGPAQAGAAAMPTPAERAESPLIDHERLAALREGTPQNALARLTALCAAELHGRLGQLAQALEAGPPVDVVAHAHGLAGLAAVYGLISLEGQLRLVEAAARATDIAAARDHAMPLDTLAARSIEALRSAVAERGIPWAA